MTDDKKFIESIVISDWQIETPDGFKDIVASHKTIEYQIYKVYFDNGTIIECADNHIFINNNNDYVFAKDGINQLIKTKNGLSKILNIEVLDDYENMYDLQLDHTSTDRTYYTNGILSRNTTTTMAYLLWKILFNPDMGIAIVANKADSAQEVLSRLQLAYEELPYWLQQGVVEWNKRSVLLENKSKIFTGATTASGIRGKSVNCVVGDTTVKIRIDGEVFDIPIDQVNELIYQKTGKYPKGYYESSDNCNLIFNIEDDTIIDLDKNERKRERQLKELESAT